MGGCKEDAWGFGGGGICAPHACTHHAGQCQERGLHLRVVRVLEQVVGLEDVVGLHPVLGDGLDEIADVLQLQGGASGRLLGRTRSG